MSLYADALDGGSQGGLKTDAYSDAELRMDQACGQGFARSTVLNSGESLHSSSPWVLSLLIFGLMLAIR